MSNSLVRNAGGDGVRIDVTPESADWRYLSFSNVQLACGATHTDQRDDQETAIVPLGGGGVVVAGGEQFELSRTSVFTEMPSIVYVTPGDGIEVTAGEDGFEFAIGSASAEGMYPTRLIRPDEMKSEVRGGGASQRQVNHVLAPPVDAERLILYEVYVPRGMWSGWAPHRHDGVDGSPYLKRRTTSAPIQEMALSCIATGPPKTASTRRSCFTMAIPRSYRRAITRAWRARAQTCSFSTTSLVTLSIKSARPRRASMKAIRGSTTHGKTATRVPGPSP